MNKINCYRLLTSGLVLLTLYLPLQATPAILGKKSRPLVSPTGNSGMRHLATTQKKGRSIITEEFYFLIKDFKIDHQTEINNLNLTVRYRYVAGIAETAYPDFRPIAKDIENALSNYPNKTDYWEVVNKRLTALVLERYPAIQSITIEMQVSPSSGDPYSRASIVTRTRVSTLMNRSRGRI